MPSPFLKKKDWEKDSKISWDQGFEKYQTPKSKRQEDFAIFARILDPFLTGTLSR